jgi:hypothetical protein
VDEGGCTTGSSLGLDWVVGYIDPEVVVEVEVEVEVEAVVVVVVVVADTAAVGTDTVLDLKIEARIWRCFSVYTVESSGLARASINKRICSSPPQYDSTLALALHTHRNKLAWWPCPCVCVCVCVCVCARVRHWYNKYSPYAQRYYCNIHCQGMNIGVVVEKSANGSGFSGSMQWCLTL